MAIRFLPKWRKLRVALAICALPVAAAAQQETAPRPALIIAYHTAPTNWLAFRAALERDVLPRLDHLQNEGVLRDFHLFLARDVDAEGWNTMAVLDFNGVKGRTRWDVASRITPAGLNQQELALTTRIDSTPVNLMREGTDDSKPDHPVFVIIPYRVIVSDDAYLKYLDGYTVPQLEGWKSAGILPRYSIYMGQYPAGRPWTAMLVLEYSGDRALAKRDAVKARVRETLAHDPAWKAISEDKSNIRAELSAAVADEAKPQ